MKLFNGFAKFFILFFLILNSCGKKTNLDKPPNYSRPDFSSHSDEL